jgi:NitT/TauT family transport system substrate-binding protein
MLKYQYFDIHISRYLNVRGGLMTDYRRCIQFTKLLLLGLLLSGCGATPTATPIPATPVTMQLSWTHEYSLASFYTAELNGHFAEQNLDVTLLPGGFVDGSYIEPIDQVVNGEVDFGASNSSSLLQARADGKPVVAVASILHRSPTAVISLSDANIQTPADLVGKTVAIAEGGATDLFVAMLTSQGIDTADVNIVPRPGFGVDPLLNGDVDALVGWIFNEGVLVQEAGLEANFLLLTDYGIPGYNNLVFTTEQMINDHPDVVEGVVRALVAGIQDVIDNPDQAIDYTLQYNDTLDRDQQLRRLQASIPLIQPARTQVGTMDEAVWQDIETIMLDVGLLTESVDVNTVFTSRFLDEIYGQ